MAVKAESVAFDESEERFTLLREVVGIMLGFFALLLLLSLIFQHSDASWIGQRGAWAASTLTLILGRYAAFALPAMLFVSAFHLLCPVAVEANRNAGWVRGFGGLLILISACALLTLPALHEGVFDRERSLALGGIVGNFLMHPSGLGLARQLGSVGSGVVFGGCALIGLVLFTRTLVRELAALGWSGLRRMFGLLAFERLRKFFAQLLRSLIPARLFARIFSPFFVAWSAMRNWKPIDALAGLFVSAGAFVIGFFRLPKISWGQPQLRVFGQSGAPDSENPAAGLLHPAPVSPQADRSRSRVLGRMIEPQSPPARDDFDPPFRRVEQTPPAPPAELRPLLGGDESSQGIALERPRPEMPTAKPTPPQRPTRTVAVQPMMELFPADYALPSLDLLADPPSTRYVMSDEEKDALARKIEQTLATFKVDVQVAEVIQGPVITRFALKLAAGVRVNRILALESELAMAMKAHHVRILAPIPGQSAVGVEVPNKRPNSVMLKELLECDEFQHHRSSLAFALGKNISGDAAVCDLAQMPHLLIAGATGSGKSVCLNTIIASFLYRNKPDRIKFVMIDPKRVELSIYQAIPHLWTPVVTEAKKAAAALAWCVEQMEGRYKLLEEIGVRNIDGYNALVASDRPSKKMMGRRDLAYMPHVVIIIDELADLMMVAKNEVEEYIIRLAQMARAVGMHLILATQRPSVNVITGIIKANFPSRIAFQVSSKVDSRTILDMNGAEALMGRGDMLYSPGGVKPFRLQGAFVADAEVERLADYIREQEKVRYQKEDFEIKPTPAERAKAQRGFGEEEGYEGWDEAAAAERDRIGTEEGFGEEEGCEGWDEAAAAEREQIGTEEGFGDAPDAMATRGRAADAPLKPCDLDAMSDEELYSMALKLVLESRKGSVSYIQRRMKIGYARAGRIMDLMEERGIVGPYQGSRPRDLLVDPRKYLTDLGS